jgi:hypothetical protein
MKHWQPIETAPKDGTVIDVWCPSIGRMTDVYWLGMPSSCWFSRNAFVNSIVEPTHWQPLPEPPKGSE